MFVMSLYRYEKQDNKHYEAFRFQDGSGEVKDFTPNSDMSYIAFRQQMMKEWNDMMFGGGGKWAGGSNSRYSK